MRRGRADARSSRGSQCEKTVRAPVHGRRETTNESASETENAKKRKTRRPSALPEDRRVRSQYRSQYGVRRAGRRRGNGIFCSRTTRTARWARSSNLCSGCRPKRRKRRPGNRPRKNKTRIAGSMRAAKPTNRRGPSNVCVWAPKRKRNSRCVRALDVDAFVKSMKYWDMKGHVPVRVVAARIVASSRP